MRRQPIVLLALTALAWAPAVALERSERTLTAERAVVKGSSVVVENLLGGVEIVPTKTAGKVRISARVVAEAKEADEAKSLAGSIRIDTATAGGETRFHVVFPVQDHEAFRPPGAGIRGVLGRWATPVFKDASAVSYDGRSVRVGPERKATGLAVYLTVELPFDVRASVRQFAGSIAGHELRATLRAETTAGDIHVERSFGALEAVSASGRIEVKLFQGSALEVRTEDGAIELESVRVERARVGTHAGSIRSSELTAGDLVIDGADGDVQLVAVEPTTASIATKSGSIDLSTYLRGARKASIRTETGDVTLRVGDLAHFDLDAETKSGEVNTLKTELTLLGQAGKSAQLRRGKGGAKLDVVAPEGNLTVRPFEGSRLQLLVR